MDLAKDHDGGREYWDSWQQRSYETKHAAWVLWKYHNRPAEELYDLRNDPKETRNLASDTNYVSILEKLRPELEKWRERQGDSARGPYEPPEKKRNRNVTPYIFK
jgi:uncharacterized sulfatase